MRPRVSKSLEYTIVYIIVDTGQTLEGQRVPAGAAGLRAAVVAEEEPAKELVDEAREEAEREATAEQANAAIVQEELQLKKKGTD